MFHATHLCISVANSYAEDSPTPYCILWYKLWPPGIGHLHHLQITANIFLNNWFHLLAPTLGESASIVSYNMLVLLHLNSLQGSKHNLNVDWYWTDKYLMQSDNKTSHDLWTVEIKIYIPLYLLHVNIEHIFT